MFAMGMAHACLTPYRRLACAVILKAVEDYQAALKEDGEAPAAASRVGRWFSAPDAGNPANFHILCDLLGFSPEHLTARLNTPGLVRKMRIHQQALEAEYQRYRAQVDGAAT